MAASTCNNLSVQAHEAVACFCSPGMETPLVRRSASGTRGCPCRLSMARASVRARGPSAAMRKANVDAYAVFIAATAAGGGCSAELADGWQLKYT